MSVTNMPQEQLDIAIIGGGIAGLCLAVGLLRNGNAEVTIYEAAHRFGEIGAGVSIGPSAIRAMRGISPDVIAAFFKVATPTSQEGHKNGGFDLYYGEGAKAGERIAEVYPPRGEGGFGAHRAHYLDELVKLIPEGVAKFGKRVVGVKEIDGMVKLSFKDGEEAFHHTVIGCDGIHSELRKFVLGPDDPASYAVFTKKYCYRGLVPMSEAVTALGEERTTNANMYVGKHAHMLTFPVAHGKILNVVAFGSCDKWESDKWVVPSSFRDINKDFAAFGEPVQKIKQLMRSTDIWALFNHLPAKTYVKGSVAIIGDAAHASTPHQGSGAGIAIEDAFVLSSLLKAVGSKEQIRKCLEVYDGLRRERGNRLVETSREAGEMWDMEFHETGEDVGKIAANASRRQLWIWEEDLDAEISKGLKALRK